MPIQVFVLLTARPGRHKRPPAFDPRRSTSDTVTFPSQSNLRQFNRLGKPGDLVQSCTHRTPARAPIEAARRTARRWSAACFLYRSGCLPDSGGQGFRIVTGTECVPNCRLVQPRVRLARYASCSCCSRASHGSPAPSQVCSSSVAFQEVLRRIDVTRHLERDAALLCAHSAARSRSQSGRRPRAGS